VAAVLVPIPTRDVKVVRRWALPGDPHGLAVGPEGIVYVGLAQRQSVAAIDPVTGEVRREVVLDHPEIASTKELVTLRTTADRTRLLIANGSDESATILSLPQLTVLREITIEGEPIRDAVPDPAGRYIYLLGRHVHVFDSAGEIELRKLDVADPMALAVSSNGSILAVIGSHDFGTGSVTVVTMYETANFREISSDPMQTDRRIDEVLFGAKDRALMALGSEWLYEKPFTTTARAPKTLEGGPGSGSQLRMKLDFGDLVSSQRICLPDNSGPQIGVLAAPELLIYAEKRCSGSGLFAGSARRVTPLSIYGVSAYAIAYDPVANLVYATDRTGSLTIYKMPRARNVPQ
jgi:DNA-binding beta-propeller fold protein YncE